MYPWFRRTGIALAALAALCVVSGSPAAVAAPVTASAFSRPSDCPAGHSCYYDKPKGVGLLWVAPSCGFFDLGKMNPPLNDRIESIYNGGGDSIQPKNWGSSGFQPVGPALGPGVSLNYIGGAANIIDAIQVCHVS